MSHNQNKPAARVTVARALIGTLLAASAVAGITSAQVEQNRPVESATAPAANGAQPASKATDVVSDGINGEGLLAMMVNKSQVVATKLPYKTVNIANPDIADFNRVNDYEILV